MIVSDHGSFVLLNVYVPNAGAKQENMTSRGDLKIRFLHALKDKCDALRSEGREVIAQSNFLHLHSTKEEAKEGAWLGK